jgi:hypothetical protein
LLVLFSLIPPLVVPEGAGPEPEMVEVETDGPPGTRLAPVMVGVVIVPLPAPSRAR